MCFLLFYIYSHSVQMTEKRFIGIFIVEVQAISLAVFEVLTISTNSCFCPASIAKNLVLILPDIAKRILINIALDEIGPEIRTGRNGPVNQN